MKSKNRIRHSLFFRVYLYFGIILSVTAILIGVIFIRLYEQSSIKSYRSDLENQINSVCGRLSEFVEDRDYQSSSYYLEILSELIRDVYIFSNPLANNPMDSRMTTVPLSQIEGLEYEFEEVLKKAFLGEKNNKSVYVKAYQSKMLIVGAPVVDKHNDVIGAVLLINYLSAQNNIVNNGRRMIVNSVLVALLISFIIAIIFARNISHPITVMRRSALQLADGNYDYKIGLERKDEIGELAMSIDILANRLSENDQLRKNMEQMRMDFFANVSHELRTPITVLRGYTETLSDGIVTNPEKIQHYYDRMVSECKSMERLVGDLLILAKMQNPDFNIDKEPINLIQVFDDIERSAYAIAREKGIKIEIKKDNHCMMMMGDYDRLRQMFMVILDNAIKFSEKNSIIYINLKEMDKLIITIQDEGIGISEEELPFIFEKFYKSKLRQNAKGSGLGLMIAKQIALKHGGDIKVSSKLGKGTKFTFVFDNLNLEECMKNSENT